MRSTLPYGAQLREGAAGPAPSRPTKLQRTVDRVVALGVPGAMALVRVGNRTIRVASGYGNLVTHTPIRTTDRFRVGNLTKTFVSTLALQLVDDSKLSLDGTVEHWLPGVVPNGEKITVRQLLNMRSGLFDPLNEDTVILKRLKAGNLTYRYTPLELVRIANAYKPYFAPGAGWHYCAADPRAVAPPPHDLRHRAADRRAALTRLHPPGEEAAPRRDRRESVLGVGGRGDGLHR